MIHPQPHQIERKTNGIIVLDHVAVNMIQDHVHHHQMSVNIIHDHVQEIIHPHQIVLNMNHPHHIQ